MKVTIVNVSHQVLFLMEKINVFLNIQWIMTTSDALASPRAVLVEQIGAQIEFYVVGLVLLMLFDSNKVVIPLFARDTSHVLVEVVVDVLWAIAGTECLQEKFMVILLLNFFLQKFASLLKELCLCLELGMRLQNVGGFSIGKIHFMKALLFSLLPILLLLPENLVRSIEACCFVLFFVDFSILLQSLGE